VGRMVAVREGAGNIKRVSIKDKVLNTCLEE